MEWSGSNRQHARKSSEIVNTKTSTYLFGPLINAPRAHPDTVLSYLVYVMKSLLDLAIIYIQLSPDVHLHSQAMRVKWSDSQRFQNLIVHNVCGSIDQIIQGSGLETLIESAFG